MKIYSHHNLTCRKAPNVPITKVHRCKKVLRRIGSLTIVTKLQYLYSSSFSHHHLICIAQKVSDQMRNREQMQPGRKLYLRQP